MIIDSHAHLWRRSRTPQPWIDTETMAAIDRDVWVDELDERQKSAGITGAVVVQSSNTITETIDLLAAAARPSTPLMGVVGWIDLEGEVEAQLSTLAACPGSDRLVGIRHLAHQDPDPEWLLRPDVHDGLEALSITGLIFDVVVRSEQLPTVARAAQAHPDLSFVLDHLGKPPIAAGSLAVWKRDLTAIAAHDNVSAKISGLVTEADWERWSINDLRPVVDTAIALFGAKRLMFGSDWPVIDLAGGLPDWLRAARELIDEEHFAAVFADTAASVYSLRFDNA